MMSGQDRWQHAAKAYTFYTRIEWVPFVKISLSVGVAADSGNLYGVANNKHCLRA